MSQFEEFNEIFADLAVDLQSKVNELLKNYRVERTEFANKFDTMKYNLNREARDREVSDFEIIRAMEDEFKSEKAQLTGKKSFGDYQTIQGKVAVSSKGKVVVEQ